MIKHARVGVRDHARLLHAGFHRRAARDDLGAPFVAALRHARHFHGALDVLEQLLLVDGLGQEAEGAALRRLDGVGNRAVRRQQQHAEPGPLPLDFLEQLRCRPCSPCADRSRRGPAGTATARPALPPRSRRLRRRSARLAGEC